MPFKVFQATFDKIQNKVAIALSNNETQTYINATLPLQISDAETVGVVNEAALRELERIMPIALAEARSTLEEK